MGEALVYCENEFICSPARGISFDGWIRGACFDRSYCDEVGAHDPGVECIYSDLERYETGPPSGDPCPAEEAHPLSPLCGEGCGVARCPWPTDSQPDWAHTSCIGLSDERGVGVCSFHSQDPCAREFPDVLEEFVAGCISEFGAPCACLARRNDDGTLWDRAWPLFEQSCRLYASLYPEDFACVGPDWRPLD